MWLRSIFFFFIFNISYSQNISGIVVDVKTNKPLGGASVYFDNTMLGTLTNSKGFFLIDISEDIQTPLVVSFMGYETKVLYKLTTVKDLKIYLKETADVLNEVTLNSKHDWSRSLKLKEFKKHFLGESKNASSCKILNEEDIILIFDIDKKQLRARTINSILIENNNLKYLISTDLQKFEINYSYASKSGKFLDFLNVYYIGNNFYKSLEENPIRSTIKYRKSAYYGSTLHFMRTLAIENLENEYYNVYFEHYPVHSSKYITVTSVGDDNIVKVEVEKKLDIVFDNERQSTFEAEDFYIDKFGKYFPPGKVKFSGNFGRQRMGDALPLDYFIKTSTKNK